MKRHVIVFGMVALLATTLAVGFSVPTAHASGGLTPQTYGCGWTSYNETDQEGGPNWAPNSIRMTVNILELRNSSGQYCGQIEDKACFYEYSGGYSVALFNSVDVDNVNVLYNYDTPFVNVRTNQWYCVYSPSYGATTEADAWPLFRMADNAWLGNPYTWVPLPA